MARPKLYQTLYVVEFRTGQGGWLPSISSIPFLRKNAAEYRAKRASCITAACYRVSKFIRVRRPRKGKRT